MNDADMQAIERRHEGRTRGPLRTYDRTGDDLMTVGPADGGPGVAGFVRLEDAAHLVHAGADIDALLAEVRFLRRVVCDMEDDGKGAATCERYRRALEEVRRRLANYKFHFAADADVALGIGQVARVALVDPATDQP